MKNIVVSNIKIFLQDKYKSSLMEKCYDLIRKDGERYFDLSLNCFDNNEFDKYFPLVSVVIITANKFECDTLNYLISVQYGGLVNKRKDRIHIFENSSLYSPTAYLLKFESSYILHLCAAETGSYTPGGSSDLVRYVSSNSMLCPSCIISFGICYGRDPDTQMIGDVLIPRKLYPWSIGQKIDEYQMKIKHDNFNLNLEEKFSKEDIYSFISQYCDNEDVRKIKKCININSEECEFEIKVCYGNLSTGEAVVSSEEFKNKISYASRIEKELGGEMEGYGLAKECVYYTKIPCVIIKGICDWGELKNIEKYLKEEDVEYPDNLKDKLQAYASFCAGLALVDLFLVEERFLSLKFINRLKEKQICDSFHYALKEDIMKEIINFYGAEIQCDFVFDKLVKLNKIIKVEKNYNKTTVYCTERRSNA